MTIDYKMGLGNIKENLIQLIQKHNRDIQTGIRVIGAVGILGVIGNTAYSYLNNEYIRRNQSLIPITNAVISSIENKMLCDGSNGKLVYIEGDDRVILFDPSYFDPAKWDYSWDKGDKVDLVARNPQPISECNSVCTDGNSPPACLEGVDISASK